MGRKDKKKSRQSDESNHVDVEKKRQQLAKNENSDELVDDAAAQGYDDNKNINDIVKDDEEIADDREVSSSSAKKEKKNKKKKRRSSSVDVDDLEQHQRSDENDVTDIEKSKKNKKSKVDKADKELKGKSSNSSGDENENGNNDSNMALTTTTTESPSASTSESINVDKPNFFANKSFDEMPLCDKTQKALTELQYTRMTQIQSLAIPPLLSGKDLIGAAKTGSGKTLAFLIPCIELLYKTKFTNKQGTGIIIISPTRELAMQIYGVVQEIYDIGKHNQTYGLLMGGANRKTESDKLTKGINLIVCTPGRLLDHLQNTKGFIVRNLLALVMDEADRILEQGFEDDLRAILKLLPKERQTMLFSATQTKKVEDLVRLSIDNKNSIFVDIPTETNLATAAGLEQGYVTCPSDQRFLLLFTFLKKNKKKKIMVFFSSCNSVKFHCELLNYIDVPCMDIHGKQKQVKRTTTFFTFCKAKTGTMLCTDVAARGLDIPDVDWIIQFDPPDDPKEYIHRVGRTARGATGSGRALLFLTPQETGFLKYLKAASVTLNEYEFPMNKVANVQSQLQRLIESNYYLNRTARDAYRSYLLAYTSHSLRDIYNVHELDLQGVGKAFGFTNPPRVDIPSLGTKDKSRRNNKKYQLEGGNKKMNYNNNGSGHEFSASNPYGKRDANDTRQFTH